MLHDLAPGAASAGSGVTPGIDYATPGELVAAGSRLYFRADDGLRGEELWSVPLGEEPPSCPPAAASAPEHLCLGAGLPGDGPPSPLHHPGRFQVELTAWLPGGILLTGHALPLDGETGLFWLFREDNPEVAVRILDGTEGEGGNGHFQVFHTSLSGLPFALTVTDTQTGLTRRTTNPAGHHAAAGDRLAFGPLGASRDLDTPPGEELLATFIPEAKSLRGPIPPPCEPTPERLCLVGGRFAAEVRWRNLSGETGTGAALALSDGAGAFAFGREARPELFLKILDGTALNAHHWLFFGALTDVGYTLTITDRETGVVRFYGTPPGRFSAAGDVGAF